MAAIAEFGSNDLYRSTAGLSISKSHLFDMAENILEWLKQAGGLYDAEVIGIKDYSDVGMGWGAIALKDIEAGPRRFG